MPSFDKGKRLNQKFITSQIKSKGPGRYSLGQNLYLNVTPTGTAAYVFRYTIDGRVREMGLGQYNVTSLEEAREIVVDHKRLIRDGKDPLDEKKRHTKDTAPVDTFEDAAKAYIVNRQASRRWKSEVSLRQWHQTLEDYAYPVIGHLKVSEVTADHIIKILSHETVLRGTTTKGRLWDIKNETATRLRKRLELILSSCEGCDLLSGDNTKNYENQLHKALGDVRRKKVRHHPALPYRDMPALMAKLRTMDSMSARALQFCILTATRTSETLGALRSEIDFENAIWTIPAERMKAGTEHRVPLSPQALACIPDHDRAVIFTGSSAFRLSNMAMTMVLRGIVEQDDSLMTKDSNGDPCQPTVHGFRSSFRDWCSEQTGFPPQACEIALAHSAKSAVEAAYSRSDLIGMRRAMMKHWAEFADGAVPYINPHADDGAAYDNLKTPAPA